jgi:hypothetical protein
MCGELDNPIENTIDESYIGELNDLISRDELTGEDIGKLSEISKKVWENHCNVDILQYTNPQSKQKYEEKSLEYLKLYSEIKEKIGFFRENIKPTSKSHNCRLKVAVADAYLTSLQHYFDYLQKAGVKSNLDEEIFERVICEDESPYYKVKKHLLKVKAIYDELSVHYISKNNYQYAHNYYFFLGEILIKEIYYSSLINDDFLYDEEDIAFLYYNAGKAFFRCYDIIEDKYIITHYATPISSNLQSNIPDVFNTGNVMQSPEKLAIYSFEKAKELFRIAGNRKYYLECRDLLYELKSKTNDFEHNISRLFFEISKNLAKNVPPFFKILNDHKKIKEEYFRDYFMSHVNLMIEDISVAENLKKRGRSDLTIFEKTNLGDVQEAIVEFKIWGRNANHEQHSYKNVLNQLRIYMSDFEQFGIVVMINTNKSGIKQKYIEIVKNDMLFANELEEPSNESAFINLRSKHFSNSDREKTINIYHFILNTRNLFD